MSVNLEDTPYTRQKVRVPDVTGRGCHKYKDSALLPGPSPLCHFFVTTSGGHSHVYLGNSYITDGLLKASLMLTSS